MTSPKQRKKGLALLRLRQEAVVPTETIVSPIQEKVVEPPPPVVVESQPAAKLKKPKAGLVELKSQDQLVEQVKEEVKTPTKE